MTAYRFTSSALAEVKESTLHYEEKEGGLGRIFLNEVDATVARILTLTPGTRYLHEQDVAALIAFPSDSFTRFVPTRFLSFP